jgi:hypothetical protein
MGFDFGKQFIYPSRDAKGVYTFVIDQQVDNRYLVKTAAEYHPVVAEYIKTVKPEKGHTQALITALGAGEFFGSNVNGDFFTEHGLKNNGDDYGYKTFEKFAKVRKHHMNKDHHPSYGSVPLSIWNDKMKRVELILKIDDHAAPDLSQALSAGQTVDWSMGAKLPFDECSICGHRSKKIDEYCEHLKFMMNKIDPISGKHVHAINRFPKFFDISHVLIGADRTNATWLKVANAEHSQYVAPHRYEKSGSLYLSIYKEAEVSKKADLDKKIPSNPSPAMTESLSAVAKKIADKIEEKTPLLPMKTMQQLGSHNLADVMQTIFALGMVPHPAEFQTIALNSMGESRLATELLQKGIHFDPADGLNSSASIGSGKVSPEVVALLSSMIAHKSFARPVLMKRVVMMKKAGYSDTKKKFKLVKSANISIPLLATLAAIYVNLMKSKNPAMPEDALAQALRPETTIGSILGSGIIAGAAEAMDTKNHPVGVFDVASEAKPLYNNEGRLELLSKMQKRPVLMLKLSSSAIYQKMFGGLPNLIKQATIESYLSKEPSVLSGLSKVASAPVDGILASSSDLISQAKKTIADSSRVLGKVASIGDLELFPYELRPLIADLVILAETREN